MIKQSTSGELLVLSLRAHAKQSDTVKRAHQLSNGLTLKAEQENVEYEKADILICWNT